MEDFIFQMLIVALGAAFLSYMFFNTRLSGGHGKHKKRTEGKGTYDQ